MSLQLSPKSPASNPSVVSDGETVPLPRGGIIAPMDRLKHVMKWAQDNPPPKDSMAPASRAKVRARMNAYNKERCARDPNFRIAMCLRSRLGKAIKSFGFAKRAKTLAMVGCTIPDLKRHLEAQFLPGMTWENYGDWHIDHIKPVSAHNLSDPAEQQACFRYSNLQPLWARDNLRKSNFYEGRRQGKVKAFPEQRAG